MKKEPEAKKLSKNGKCEEEPKTKHALSYHQTVKRLRARERKMYIVRMILRVALIVTTLYFVWFCDGMAALGWISNARAGENWPLYFVTYGRVMLFAMVLITAGSIFCLLGFNWLSMGLAVPGTVIALIVMQLVVNYANEAGFYSTIRNMPAGAVYQDAIFPTAIVCVILIALALMQFFSMKSVQKRRAKKLHENASAPRIV